MAVLGGVSAVFLEGWHIVADRWRKDAQHVIVGLHLLGIA